MIWCSFPLKPMRLYVFINHTKRICVFRPTFTLNILTKCANFFSFDYLQTCFLFFTYYFGLFGVYVPFAFYMCNFELSRCKHQTACVWKKKHTHPFFAIIKYPWFETFRCYSLWMSASTHFYVLCFFSLPLFLSIQLCYTWKEIIQSVGLENFSLISHVFVFNNTSQSILFGKFNTNSQTPLITQRIVFLFTFITVRWTKYINLW